MISAGETPALAAIDFRLTPLTPWAPNSAIAAARMRSAPVATVPPPCAWVFTTTGTTSRETAQLGLTERTVSLLLPSAVEQVSHQEMVRQCLVPVATLLRCRGEESVRARGSPRLASRNLSGSWVYEGSDEPG